MARTQNEGLPLPRLDPPPRVLIVLAPYYRVIAEGQLTGARRVLEAAGARHDLVEVPGALEVPTAIRLAADNGAWEGYIALGCVIRGETTHYETVCSESARGLAALGTERGLAIGNCILTVETLAQAEARANPDGMDKGGGAAAAALVLIDLARRFRNGPSGGREGVADPADILLAHAAGKTRTAE